MTKKYCDHCENGYCDIHPPIEDTPPVNFCILCLLYGIDNEYHTNDECPTYQKLTIDKK